MHAETEYFQLNFMDCIWEHDTFALFTLFSDIISVKYTYSIFPPGIDTGGFYLLTMFFRCPFAICEFLNGDHTRLLRG